MTDLRKAADMALQALEFSLPAIEDFGSKEQLTDCHRAIMALYKTLAQPEQAIGDIRALKHRIHELEGEVIGYKRILDAQDEQEPVQFLANGVRYKVTHQGYYGCSIVGLPENLNGQWVALVEATDSKHLNCIPPQELAKPEQEPFQPDWVSYRQGVADGAAQTEHNHLNDAMSVLADVNADLIKEAKLAQPEQEPVAWIGNADFVKGQFVEGRVRRIWWECNTGVGQPLYTAPPKPEQESISTNDHLCAMLRQVHDVLACTALPMKRPWVGLTDEEIKDIWINTWKVTDATDAFAYAIESKLKEKNGAT